MEKQFTYRTAKAEFLYAYIKHDHRWWKQPALPVLASTHCISFQPLEIINATMAHGNIRPETQKLLRAG